MFFDKIYDLFALIHFGVCQSPLVWGMRGERGDNRGVCFCCENVFG
jgi:hypothetical protein